MMELAEYLDSIPVGHRRGRFQALAQGMLNAGRPICIIETGSLRESKVDGPDVDGCSTLVWDYVAQQSRGTCYTIDINPANAEYTRSKVSKHTQVMCCDSLRLLSSLDGVEQPIDLLYLDSEDWGCTRLAQGLSALHHLAELAAAWRWLATDALIAVDDCHEAYVGKHAMIRRFFDSIGVEPLVSDYIHVWRKPHIEGIRF